MDQTDQQLFTTRDLGAALGLLTRLPIPVDQDKAVTRGAAAAWAYPIVGLIIALILAASTAFLLKMGITAGIVAALILTISAILTGAMHEDGLADCADGLWGGWDRINRLRIMKDSHIGVYGVLALGLSLLIRWLCLVVLIAIGTYWVEFIVIAVISRAAMVVPMAALLNAREDGLSRSVGRPSYMTLWIALGLAFIITLFAVGLTALWLFFIAAIATGVCMMIAKVKIGGQTGDILGGTQQIVEIALLIAIVTPLG